MTDFYLIAFPTILPADSSPIAHRRAKRWALAGAIFVLVIPALVLLGWTFDLEALKRVLPGMTAMNPVTAIGFLLAGVILVGHSKGTPTRWFRRSQTLAAWIILGFGMIKIVEYLVGIDRGLDTVFFPSRIQMDDLGPNRMAPNTALAFLGVGLAFLFLDWKTAGGKYPSQWLAVIVGLVSLFSILGYIYDVKSLYRLSTYTAMAVHTALCFAMVTTAIILLRPERGFMAVLTSGSAGGVIARRLLLPILVVIPLLGWMRLHGEHVGWFGPEVGTALNKAIEMFILVCVVGWMAASLHRADLERIATEHAASRHRNLLQNVMDSVGEGVVVADSHGCFLHWNPAASRILRQGATELPPQEWSKHYRLFLADGATPFPTERLPLLRAIRGECVDDEEIVFRDQVGEQAHWIQVSSRPLRDASGNSSGGVAVFRDFTEERESREAIRAARDELERLVQLRTEELKERKKAEERFRRLLESAPDAIVIVDQEGKIVLVNSQAETTFGYKAPELIGQPVEFLIPDRLRAAHCRHRDAYAKAPRVRDIGASLEFQGLRKGGQEIPVEISLSPLQTDEGLLVISSIRDITERKKLQMALQKAKDELEVRVEERTAELTRSNHELNQFAYVASHDLQQPLRMVSSYVQLLERRLGDKLGSDERDFIQYAVEGTSRMKRLIDDLLTFSRVGTHGKPLDRTNAEQILLQTLRHLEPAIVESGAQITHEPLPTVLADETQLTQLFQNLLDNAIKYRSSRPPKIHVWAQREGAGWLFSFSDNGIGIDPQYFDRIFLMFQRLHGKNEYSGTGVGLAVCKKVVERHGGRLWVESEVGEGSVFRFTIPFQETGDASVDAKTDRNPVGGRRTR